MKNTSMIKHGPISTEKITDSVWIAKTKTEEPMKAEIEVKGNTENDSYNKLMAFIESTEKPSKIIVLPNGNTTYHFKNQ